MRPSRRPPVFLRAATGALFLLAAAFGPATAAERPVSFCFNDWEPYAKMAPNGPGGISVAIVSEAARRLGVKVSFRELPWKRCLQSVRAGETDAVLDAARRNGFAQGPTSFSIYSDTYWVRDDAPITAYSDLQGGKIGLVEGYNYDDKLLAHMETLELRREYAVDDRTNIRKLAFGRVDAIISDLASGLFFAQRHSLRVRPILPAYSLNRLYTSFNTGAAALQRRFDGAFAELMAEGFVDATYRHHIGKTFSRIIGTD